MPSPNTTIAGILWGASFANTWHFPAPLDSPMPDSAPIGAPAESSAGTVDFWQTRQDEILRCRVPLIPRLDNGAVTGYTTATTGVRTALAWLRAFNLFRFCPDITVPGTYHTCVLLPDEPPAVGFEAGGAYRSVKLAMRDTSATPFAEY